jgi:hypothetical protein
MARRVLIVTTVEHPEEALRMELDESDAVRLVVPIVRQSVLDWFANDQAAYTHAEVTAERIAAELPGATVAASAGEDDVGLAIHDALATFPADEIVVAIPPKDEQGAVESGATAREPRTSFAGIPVRYLVIGRADTEGR